MTAPNAPDASEAMRQLCGEHETAAFLLGEACGKGDDSPTLRGRFDNAYTALLAAIANLEREIRYLREYGDPACTQRADEELGFAEGGLDPDE